MNKKVFIIITFILSFFAFNNVIKADNMAMWLDCDYRVYAEDAKKLQTGRHLVFIGGKNSDAKDDGYYRLLNPKTFEEHSPALNTWIDDDNPRFDYCWFYNEEDIGESCDDDDVKKYTDSEALQMLREGRCPAIIRDADGLKSNEVIVFAGIGKTNSVYHLTNQYRFYKDGNDVYGYGYNINGYFLNSKNGEFIKTYDLVAVDGVSGAWRKNIVSTSALGVEKYGEKFMNVGELDYAASILPKSAEVVFDGNSNIDKLYAAIDEWYNEYNISSTSSQGKADKMNKIKSDYSQLINSCTALNESYDSGVKYTFSSSYTASRMLVDLKNMFADLDSFYNIYSDDTVVKYDSCTSNEKVSNASYSAYNCSMVKLLGSIDYVPEGLQEYVLSDVARYLSEVKDVYVDDSDEVLNTVVKCATYLDKNSDDFNIDNSDISDIASEYKTLGNKHGITIVYDCESLLGEDLIKKIDSYLNIFKIAIPIVLIMFGIIDYVKVVFSGTDDEMKKAQKDFLKRIFIAILIYLTPIVVNLILTIANQVWSFISPNSCGIF